jgi:hypothetical protein
MTSRFSMERLCAHVTFEVIHVDFSFDLFLFFKCIKYGIQNKGSIFTQELKQRFGVALVILFQKSS